MTIEVPENERLCRLFLDAIESILNDGESDFSFFDGTDEEKSRLSNLLNVQYPSYKKFLNAYKNIVDLFETTANSIGVTLPDEKKESGVVFLKQFYDLEGCDASNISDSKFLVLVDVKRLICYVFFSTRGLSYSDGVIKGYSDKSFSFVFRELNTYKIENMVFDNLTKKTIIPMDSFVMPEKVLIIRAKQ